MPIFRLPFEYDVEEDDYEEEEEVEEKNNKTVKASVSEKDFENEVMKSEEPWLIGFFGKI